MAAKDFTFRQYHSDSKQKARILRKEQTRQERKLWYDYLKTYPIKFYRQRPIDFYIADFYCSRAKLIIELDGSQHFTEAGKEYDAIRTETLEQLGLTVLRFTNQEVDEHFSDVCQRIDEAVKEKTEI